MSARGSSPGFCCVSASKSRTAWELAPDSNQTSRMSISLRNSVWPHSLHEVLGGRISSGAWMYQASADSLMKRSTMSLLMATSLSGVEHLRQRKTAMGTPQMRWREMHQSGRVATMLVMRSWPQAGSQVTVLISSRARWRKVVVFSDVCGAPEEIQGSFAALRM